VAAFRLRANRLVRVSSTVADQITVTALDDAVPGAVRSWAAYPLGVAWGLGQVGADLAAVEALRVGDLATVGG
jgi:galactokinase